MLSQILTQCDFPFPVLHRYVEAGTLMNNYAHIFDLLTRLRQVKKSFTIVKILSIDCSIVAFCDEVLFTCELFAAIKILCESFLNCS